MADNYIDVTLSEIFGTGVASVEQTQTSEEPGGLNVWTITLTNGYTSTFTVRNGTAGGTPMPVVNSADMTDTNGIYLYLGNEEGYTTGHWYCYANGMWTDFGAYSEKGEPGFAPTVETSKTGGTTTVTITDAVGEHVITIEDGISPTVNVANTAADMTDTSLLYVYAGSETGYTNGNWYFYNTTTNQWTSGGQYQSTVPRIDTSLTVQGAAADSAKVGQEISELKSKISDIEEQIEGGGTGGGLTNQIKTALLNCFANVMFKSSNSANLIGALREALYSDYVAVSGISLNYSTLSIEIGSTEQLRATVLPTNASDKSVIWSSNNSNVATVDNSGNVTAVSEGVATITATTNDGGYTATCQTTVSERIVVYTVSNNLTGCTNSNSATSVNDGSNYVGEIAPLTGYRMGSVTVLMGGNDITASAYSNGTISISNVTGNIVITATATEIGNILQNTVVTTGKYLKTNDGTIGNSGTEFVTDDIDISAYAGQVILIKFIGATASTDAYRFAFYDASNTFIECKYTTLTSMSYEVPANAKYMKLGGKFAGMTGITIAVAKNSINSDDIVRGGYYGMEDGTISADNYYSHVLLDVGACWAKVVNCSSFVSLDASQNFISAGKGDHNSGNIEPATTTVYIGMNVRNTFVATAILYGTEDYQIGSLSYSA